MTYPGLYRVKTDGTSEDGPNFRGIRDRTLADQMEAARKGYNGVVELAIDELARRLILLEQRMDACEEMIIHAEPQPAQEPTRLHGPDAVDPED